MDTVTQKVTTRLVASWLGAYPIKVNSLQAMTYGNKLYAIDYDQIPMTDLSEFEEDIHKIV
jgi:hypothetical protein